MKVIQKLPKKLNYIDSNCPGKILFQTVDFSTESPTKYDNFISIFNRTLQAFRKANIATMLEIEKIDKEELFTNPESELRHRNSTKHSRSSLVSQQDSVTEKMLAISRHLSETTQKSAITLETLVASSANVEGTRDELQTTAGTISQSGKLLQKYGRRECTDKILLFFAFAFFIACVLYIVQRRLF